MLRYAAADDALPAIQRHAAAMKDADSAARCYTSAADADGDADDA